jgi:hypothetical protein
MGILSKAVHMLSTSMPTLRRDTAMDDGCSGKIDRPLHLEQIKLKDKHKAKELIGACFLAYAI